MENFNVSFSVPEGSNLRGSRMSRRWRNVSMPWSRLVEQCAQTRRTSETMDEFLAMKHSSNRDEKMRAADIKDVGGFFGGTLDDSGLRQKAHVEARTLITLDIDDTVDKFLSAQAIWNIVRFKFPDTAAVAHTTHTHTPQAPRMRLVIPLSQPVAPEYYPVLAKAVADAIGPDLMDTTAFSPEHFMYWASTSADGEFLSFVNPGAPLDVRAYSAFCHIDLGQDGDQQEQRPVKDAGSAGIQVCDSEAGDATCGKASNNPAADGKDDEHLALVEGPGLPLSVAMAALDGEESIFCRTYTIEDAIDKYLPTVYCNRRDCNTGHETARYTYAPAGSADGLVCYDHFWARSFHNSDPAGGRNLNAFQLVRTHLFGHLDKGCNYKRRRSMPSYKAMVRMCRDMRTPQKADSSGNPQWQDKLERDKKDRILPTAANLASIFANDPCLGMNIRFDTFAGCIRCSNKMVWDVAARLSTRWTDFDDCHLRGYFDTNYGIYNRNHMIFDSMVSHATRNSYHPVCEYLRGLDAWDGTPRVETLLRDYLGAADTPLNRQMTRKWMAAAVKRVFEPGCKFDYCLVLKGEQGVGKSSLFEVLGGEYHNGSLNQIEGKEGRECLQGSWIVEFSELSAMRRSEVETIKAFITDRTDRYRAAYGRHCTDHPRQCVFCATTNSDTFLKDETGNRRFWVVAVDPRCTGKTTSERIALLGANRDQIWAEAYQIYLRKEPLFLNKEMEAELKQVQLIFTDQDDDLEDRLDTYLETPIPYNWRSMTLAERRLYYSGSLHNVPHVALEERKEVTVREFVCEMLQTSPDRLDRTLCRRIKRLMRQKKGWKETANNDICTGWAGRQRGFVRVREAELPTI